MRWADSTAADVSAAAARGAVALWPIGATEQHGPHIATGMDLCAADAVARRAADSPGVDAVVLPGLAIGASNHWLGFGGTLSLHVETLVSVLVDVTQSVAAGGFAHMIVLNGHAGNIGPALTAASTFSESDLAVEVASYWQLISPAELSSRCVADDGGIGHAGEIETSIAQWLDPPLTRSAAPGAGYPLKGGPGSRQIAFARTPRPRHESPSGVYGDPRPASAPLGRFVIEQAAEALAERCRTLVAERGKAS